MERINNEIYVSLEIAKLLKQAGFNLKVEHCYYNGEFDKEYYWPFDFNKYCLSQISAPTLETAQRWLREVKHEFVGVYPVTNKWFYSILRPNFGHYYKNKQFNTYEEAQEAGIKKVLEIILKKEK